MHSVFVHLQRQCTPLYVASAEGFNDVAKTLIVANADTNCVCIVSQLLTVIYICTYIYEDILVY